VRVFGVRNAARGLVKETEEYAQNVELRAEVPRAWTVRKSKTRALRWTKPLCGSVPCTVPCLWEPH